MKRSFFAAVIFGSLLCSASCDRVEYIKINGQELYRFTNVYIATIDNIVEEPPYVIETEGTYICSEIYRVQWNDRALVATQYPEKSPVHRYFILLPRDTVVLTGNDIKLGPLTQRQRDSVLLLHKIDTVGMEAIDFN